MSLKPTPVTQTLECAHLSQINLVGGKEYTLTVGARPDLTRDDGSPSQAGDVLSCDQNGQLTTRAAGTTGPFERVVFVGTTAIFRPEGPGGRAYMIPYAPDAPNW